MNCDQAFEMMTDPVLDDSTALHDHLDSCPRCLQMYETLSPALGLFAPADTGSLTGLHDAESETASSVEIAERVAVSLSATPSAARPQGRLRPLAIYAAVGIVTFSTVLGLLMMFSTPSVPAPLRAADCLWLNRDAADEERSSESVVRSCMTCHVSVPPRTTDLQRLDPRLTLLAGFIN